MSVIIANEPFDDFTTNGWAISGGGTTMPTIIGGGHSGNGAEVKTAGTNNGSARYTIAGGSQTANLVVGFWWKITDFNNVPIIVAFYGDGDSTLHNAVRVGDTAGTLYFSLGGATLDLTGSGVVAINTWYYIEVALHLADSPNGTYTVKVNGTTVMSSGGTDTKNGGTGTVYDTIRLGPNTTFGSPISVYDDLYLRNDTTFGVGVDGTATPSAIALSVTTPAPTATGVGNGTATPAAIARTVVVPAPAMSNHPVLWEPFHDYTTNSWVLTGSPTATLVTGRNTAQSPNLAANLGSTIAGNASVLTYTIPSVSESDWLVFGTAWKSTSIADTEVAEFTSDTNATRHVQLWVGASGDLQVRSSGSIRGTSSTGLIVANTWYYLEIRVHLGDSTAGSWEVRLNGVTAIALTAGDTKNGGTKTVFDAVRLTPTNNLTSTANYDDLYLDTGSAVTFLGDPSGTATPSAITLSVVTPAPTATGGSASGGTATPAAIALSVVVPAPTVEEPAVLAATWGPLVGELDAVVSAFTPAVLAATWGPMTGAASAVVYPDGVIPGPVFPCGGFVCFGATGLLTIDGQVLNCPAWDIPNLARLWAEAAVRGENRKLPTVPGARGYPTRVDQTDFDLTLFIRGAYADQTGAPTPSEWEGLEANVDALWANVFAPVTTGRGTRTAVLTMPDGSLRIADVQVGPPQAAADIDDPALVETSFRLVVVSGRFAAV